MGQIFSQEFKGNIDSAIVDFPGGVGTVKANGTFGGGTLELHLSDDGGATFAPCGTTCQLTAPGAFNFEISGDKTKIKLVLSGATTPSVKGWVTAGND